ncbi:MAG: hypothetical protein AAFS13_03010 [Pseudomonadota bacterium]
MSENMNSGVIEANLRAMDYVVDKRSSGLVHFSKSKIDFYFAKTTEGHLHFIFHPDLFGRILRTQPKCREIRISKSNEMAYPNYFAEDGARTSCGVGMYFSNDRWGDCKTMIKSMETA